MERLRSHGQSRRNTNARVSRRGACTVLVLSPHADAPLPRGNVQINAKYRKVYSLRSTRKREREREREEKRNTTGPLCSLRAIFHVLSSAVQQYRSGQVFRCRFPPLPPLASRIVCKISQNLARYTRQPRWSHRSRLSGTINVSHKNGRDEHRHERNARATRTRVSARKLSVKFIACYWRFCSSSVASLALASRAI